MRICVLSEYFFPYVGGGQVHAYELSKALIKRGCEVHVICNKMKKCKDREIMDGIHVYRVGVVGEVNSIYRRGRYVLSSVKKAKELHKKCHFDLVHAHIFGGALAGVVAGKTLHLPVVTTVHGLFTKTWKEIAEKGNILSKRGEKFVIKLPYDKLIAVSQMTARQIRELGVPGKKIEVIPNGVDLKKFNLGARSAKKHLGIKEDYVVAFFGRLWKVKGVEYLVKAIPSVVDEIPNVKFLIVGEGPQKESLMELAKDLGVSEHVMFHAPIGYSEMPSYLTASDCVVLPSLMDGLPVTALEAMSCRVPVLATKVGGTPEVVKDGKNGFLLEPKRPKPMAKKVIQLLRDEKLRKRMGEAGRKFVKNYDWDVIAGRTFEVYRELLRAHKRARSIGRQ